MHLSPNCCRHYVLFTQMVGVGMQTVVVVLTTCGVSHLFRCPLSFSVVNPSVDNLYSIARESIQRHARNHGSSKEDAFLKVQAEILEMDDIEDFGSDDEKTPSEGNSMVQIMRGAKGKHQQHVQDIIIID
jgi:hypothetical protein